MSKDVQSKWTYNAVIAVISILVMVCLFLYNKVEAGGELRNEVSRLRIDHDDHMIVAKERIRQIDEMSTQLAVLNSKMDAMQDDISEIKKAVVAAKKKSEFDVWK